MEKYKILEHPSDVKIQASGETKEELFLNAALGMNAILKPKILDYKSETRKIKVKSADVDALLVDFLSEILYLIQTNKEVYDNIEFSKFSDTELEGALIGSKTDSFNEDIKGVTYHDLKIKQKNGLYEVVVLFDV